MHKSSFSITRHCHDACHHQLYDPATTCPTTPKTVRRELTQAEVAETIGAHRYGAKAAEIAACFGHPKQTVYYTIRMNAQRGKP
jgi:hypothetical protein